MAKTTTSATINSVIASARIARTNYCTKDAQPFRELVEDYMMRTFWYAKVKIEREQKLETINGRIEGLSNLRGSVHWTDANASQLLSLMDERAEQESKLDEWIKKEVRWSVGKDSVLAKTYDIYKKHMQNGDTPDYSIRQAVNYLYEQYGLVCGTEDMLYLMENLKGREPETRGKKIYKSGQTVWSKERTKNNFCKLLMSTLAEILMSRNAVRPAKVAPELEAIYNEARKNSKKSKKNSKKN